MLFSLFSSAMLNRGGLSKSRWDLYVQFSFSYLFSSAPLDHWGSSRSRWDFACTTVFLFYAVAVALLHADSCTLTSVKTRIVHQWFIYYLPLHARLTKWLCVCTYACCMSCMENVSLCHDQCPSVAQNQNMSIFLKTILTGRKQKGWHFSNKFHCLRLVVKN